MALCMMQSLSPGAAAQRSTFLGRPFETRECRRPLFLSTSCSPRYIKINGGAGPEPQRTSTELSRKADFPSDFLFGAGCSAFQIEGAPTSGGRGMTIWDSFVHIPGQIEGGELNYPGCDFYHLYEDDIKLAKDLGFNAFRFSISWTRIYPYGAGAESAEGIAYYNGVINALIKAGLTPLATLFHWETPQYLENDPDILGFRTKNIVPYFERFAETCFKHFGDRVKFWTTINEMWTFAVYGYGTGVLAPGRCSTVSGNECDAGDSQTEVYLVGHNLLLAHAKVYQLYKNKYKVHQQGICGFNPCHFGAAPYSDKQDDKLATQRYLEFFSAWQIDPVVFGDYPKSMRDAVGDRLPKFTKEESEELKNSCDFLGHNYYTAYFIKNADVPKDPSQRWYGNDGGTETSVQNEHGEYIGAKTGASSSWVYNCALQLPPLLEWLEERYGKIPCYITENGAMDKTPNNSLDAINDEERITYLKDHLTEISKAIKDKGINVKGYFHWSFLDVFEWNAGFQNRFGLVRVEIEDGKPPIRTPKSSAKWFQEFLAS
eukprot:c16304_g1_i1 orf=285-1916(-)